MDNRGNSRANTCCEAQLLEAPYLLDNRPIFLVSIVVNHSNLSDRLGFARDKPFKFLPHQLSMVVYWTTMAFTGNGGLGFDSGEGA